MLDEPTAALGVRESNQVLELIKNLRDRGIPVILISHNMPQVFDVADRIHIQRLGKRAATITPESHSMTDAVAIMTGARAGMSGSNAAGRVELVAGFTALPGREEEVGAPPPRAHGEGAREPGCLGFAPHRVAPPPDGTGRGVRPEPIGARFVVIEAYRDEAAFARHLAAPYGASFNASLVPLIEEDRLGAHLPGVDRLSPAAAPCARRGRRRRLRSGAVGGLQRGRRVQACSAR